ncbi:hypothetical protein [Legionella parisiensis]|uniref:Uncharacterized protein n=1 Tax=Legionella parisiensis TaxID=45071 RepID=A0A1E5JQJ3_9GAMM|nr:hypothetical protein [Legionella parisiensis]KTD40180.1 hypothetical protein Lpar_1497 [Legionella parisiensis]OEH46812.1 hypothetical protein lpari_02280 [Legionella parisiensis]STX77707.1 Uncharacterised protein [Legionella parisiensis]
MSLEKAIKIAQTILADIQKNIVTRNSIIPLSELPFVYEDEIKQYRVKFGKSFDLLLQSITNLNLVRDASEVLVKKAKGFQEGATSTYMLQQLAVAYCKMGACGELSTYALFALLKQLKEENIDLPITFIALDSKKKNIFTGESYNHACLLIGEVEINPGERIDKFSKLPDTVICFDPSIGWIAPANKMLEINQVFFAAHEIDHVTTEHPGVILFQPNDKALQKKALKIEAAARILSNQILEKLKGIHDFKPFSLENKSLPKLAAHEFSFINQNTKKDYEDALEKCTSSLFEDSLSHWKYYPRRDGDKPRPAQILLSVKDEDKASVILDHLIKHKITGVHPTMQRVQATGYYAVLIVEPNLVELRDLPKIGKNQKDHAQALSEASLTML